MPQAYQINLLQKGQKFKNLLSILVHENNYKNLQSDNRWYNEKTHIIITRYKLWFDLTTV